MLSLQRASGRECPAGPTGALRGKGGGGGEGGGREEGREREEKKEGRGEMV